LVQEVGELVQEVLVQEVLVQKVLAPTELVVAGLGVEVLVATDLELGESSCIRTAMVGNLVFLLRYN
jgi:hypothetical protein